MHVEDFDGNEFPSQEGVKKEGTSTDNVSLDMIKSLQEQLKTLQSKIESGSSSKQDTNDSKLLREIVSQLKGGTNEGLYDFRERYVQDYEFDADDELPREKWVTFVAHTVAFLIVDDKKNGKAYRVPYGPIVFTYDSTRRVQNGKETEITNLSRYTCKSQKELDFLRTHSNYGIFFFENMRGATVDANKSMKLISIHSSLKALGIHELIPYARKYELDVTVPIDLLRTQIANAYVDEQIESEQKSNELRVNESFIEQQLIKK